MSAGPAIVIAIVLLAGNAFFVGAEFAIVSARRSQIEPMADRGSRSAKTVLWAMEHVSLMLACAQLGVTVCSTGLGVVAEPAIAHLIDGPMQRVGVPAAISHVVAFAIALCLVVYLHVVLGEMVPKNLAVSGPERAVLLFGPPLVWLSRVLSPVIRALNWFANLILRMFRFHPQDEIASAYTAEEVASIVEHSQAEGVLVDTEGLLTKTIEFSDKTANAVMIPTEDLVAVSDRATPAEVEREVARTGFSRFPVRRENAVVGYLHLKDVLYASESERCSPVPLWRIRAVTEVGADDEIEDVLTAMQKSGAHLALVLAGGKECGVVFLEDILEELVGEVRDAMQR